MAKGQDEGINAQIEKLLAEKKKLEEENLSLKNAQAKQAIVNIKIAAKGGISVYGLGRFPVTLYKEQWQRLGGLMPDILKYIEDNDSKLKSKG